jgi:hypothetical protein
MGEMSKLIILNLPERKRIASYLGIWRGGEEEQEEEKIVGRENGHLTFIYSEHTMLEKMF